jgi:hypothetical protein
LVLQRKRTQLSKIIAEKLERSGLMNHELFKKRRRFTDDSEIMNGLVECIIDFLQKKILPHLDGYQQYGDARAILREKMYNKTKNLKTYARRKRRRLNSAGCGIPVGVSAYKPF